MASKTSSSETVYRLVAWRDLIDFGDFVRRDNRVEYFFNNEMAARFAGREYALPEETRDQWSWEEASENQTQYTHESGEREPLAIITEVDVHSVTPPMLTADDRQEIQ